MDTERPNFDIEREITSKKWMSVDGHLVVMPSISLSDYSDRVLSRLEAVKLERTPSIEELDNFKSVIVTENIIENSSSSEEEELRVQSLWLGNGPWTNMGAIFPNLRIGLDHFQTLQGLLYPSTVGLKKDFSVEDSAGLESWLQAIAPKKVWCLTRLLSPRKQAHSLEQILRPETSTRRLGIYGIGDIGSFVATFIRAIDTAESGISGLYIGGSRSKDKIEALVLELQHINIEGVRQSHVRSVFPGEEEIYFKECDTILILVASDIILPEETGDIDVRAGQYEKNTEILERFISHAAGSTYDGQILVASDPVEQLTMMAYLEMKNQGVDVSTHQLVGFGGMINRSRAKAEAEQLGISDFVHLGRTFGPHGKMVVAFPTHDRAYYNARQAEQLSLLTGHANYEVRDRGVKPYLGPAVLIAEGIQEMYGNRHKEDGDKGIIYASPFLPSSKPGHRGAFFGTRVQYYPPLEAWTPRVEQPYLIQIMEILDRVHGWVEETSFNPDAMKHDPFTSGAFRHPAFHPYMMETWLEKVASSSSNRE